MVSLDGVIDRGEYLLDMQRRIVFLNLYQFRGDTLSRTDVGDALGLVQLECRCRTAVEPRQTARLRNTIVNIGNLAQPHRLAPGHDDERVAQGFGRLGAAEHPDGLFAAADLGAAAWCVQIQLPQLLVDLESGQAQRLQARWIELHANFPVGAADALHLRNAAHTQQPFGDGVVDRPAQLLRSHVGGRDGVDGKCAAVRIFAPYLRFQDALRQIGADSGDGVAHVGNRPVDRRTDVEFDEDQYIAFGNVCLLMVNVANAGNRAFHLLRDLRFHFRGRGARLGDVDVDCRKRDIRIQVDRQANKRDGAQEKQHHEQHDGGYRVANRPGGNVFHDVPAITTGFTVSPSCRNAPAVVTI